ncbi:MAG: VPLPA-CTERM sorting domain-containing protein [Pikeienuella sp.]|uniref:VPLPA-CTERM sorting domain-containing protein n=1 Tax=Pikeienuella sp. TaxID=2831957 RepID=UPI00391952A0
MPSSRFVVLCGVALSLALGVAGARASTLSFYDDATAPSGLRFTLGCGAAAADSCAGKAVALKGAPGLFDATTGQMFDLGNSGDATELAFVNANLFSGDAALAAHGGKDELGVATIVTNALYVLVKTGGGGTGDAAAPATTGKKDKSAKAPDKTKLATAIIRNLTGGSLTLTFAAAANGTGLSHYSFFGTATPDPVAQVPLPAAGWLLLAGLAGLGFAAKRRRAA